MTVAIDHLPDGCAYPDLRAPHWDWTASPPEEAFLYRLDDEPVSILRLFHRKLIGGAVAFNVVGIGGVWTEPRFRDQQMHVESHLLSAACERIQRRAILAAVVYVTPERADLYCKQGFVRVQPYLHIRSLVPGLQFTEEEPAVPTPWWRLDPDGRF